jgi:hypothetical protein
MLIARRIPSRSEIQSILETGEYTDRPQGLGRAGSLKGIYRTRPTDAPVFIALVDSGFVAFSLVFQVGLVSVRRGIRAAAIIYFPTLFTPAEAFVIGEKPEGRRFSSNLTGLSPVHWAWLT